MLYKIEFCIDNPMEFFKNLSQIIFYCVTATLAIYGVIKWRKELLGDQKYKLAKNLLAHSYRLRDSIRSCQVSFTPMGEYENREKFENETEHNKSLYTTHLQHRVFLAKFLGNISEKRHF